MLKFMLLIIWGCMFIFMFGFIVEGVGMGGGSLLVFVLLRLELDFIVLFIVVFIGWFIFEDEVGFFWVCFGLLVFYSLFFSVGFVNWILRLLRGFILVV